MTNKDVNEVISEIKKIRLDLDKIQAAQKTIAEQLTALAENTAPAKK